MLNKNTVFPILAPMLSALLLWGPQALAVEKAAHKPSETSAKAPATSKPAPAVIHQPKASTQTQPSTKAVKSTSQKESWQQSLDEIKASISQLSEEVTTGAAKTSEIARQNIKSDIDKSAQRLRELGDDLSQAVRQADTETRTSAQATIKELNEALTKLSAKLETKKAATDDEEYPDDVEFPELEE